MFYAVKRQPRRAKAQRQPGAGGGRDRLPESWRRRGWRPPAMGDQGIKDAVSAAAGDLTAGRTFWALVEG